MADGDEIIHRDEMSALVVTSGPGRIISGGVRRVTFAKRLHDVLLENAEELHNIGQNRAAVVVAHAAVEVCTARALAALFAHRGIDEIGAAMFRETETISPKQDRIQRLWMTMTGGDELTSASWWKDYDASNTLRNRVAHNGHTVDSAAGERAIKRCEEATVHMRTTLDALGVTHELLSNA
jgi:hypothetical protein